MNRSSVQQNQDHQQVLESSLTNLETLIFSNKSKVAPKYKHPDDISLTWSGRGVAPDWYKELLAQGYLSYELLIKT